MCLTRTFTDPTTHAMILGVLVSFIVYHAMSAGHPDAPRLAVPHTYSGTQARGKADAGTSFDGIESRKYEFRRAAVLPLVDYC